MNYQVIQSTTTYPLVFFMTDATDGRSGKTGLSPTVTLSKNGGSFASPSGAVSEIGSGWYKVAGNATDQNTLGPLILHATGTGADATEAVYEVVTGDAYAALTANRAEPGQGAPSATTSMLAKLDYIYKAWRNKKTQTATTTSLFADDGTTVDQKSTVSDDGTTFTSGEIVTGP